jgi:dipeptidase
MANDMVVALARATVDGQTLFGHNCNLPPDAPYALVRTPGRDHAPGEVVRAADCVVPQPRHTFAVLAGRSAGFGYEHGVNERGVVAGWAPVRTRLVGESPCLTGPDLVRLALERAGTALQAVEVVTDLVGRFGQGAFAGEGENSPDAALLLADGREAYVLEAAGRHWVLAQAGSVRAVGASCFMRKDWDRISRGLSDLAIHRGWWPEDGCKLDFAGALGRRGPDVAEVYHRWGRATLQLEQHSGAIDGAFLRRLLREQGDALQRPERWGPDGGPRTAASLVVAVGPGEHAVPTAWCAFGPPSASIYLPVVPAADLPAAYTAAPGEACPAARLLDGWRRRNAPGLPALLAEVQQQLDEQCHEFIAEAGNLARRGESAALGRLASSLMHHGCERLAELSGGVARREEGVGAAAGGAEF